MKTYKPHELEKSDPHLYNGAVEAFQAAVPTFIDNIVKVLESSGAEMLTHGSFCRMTDDDDTIVYIQLVGAFALIDDEGAYGLVEVTIYDSALEYDIARIETMEKSKAEFGESFYGVPSTTEMGGKKIIDNGP